MKYYRLGKWNDELMEISLKIVIYTFKDLKS